VYDGHIMVVVVVVISCDIWISHANLSLLTVEHRPESRRC